MVHGAWFPAMSGPSKPQIPTSPRLDHCAEDDALDLTVSGSKPRFPPPVKVQIQIDGERLLVDLTYIPPIERGKALHIGKITKVVDSTTLQPVPFKDRRVRKAIRDGLYHRNCTNERGIIPDNEGIY